MSERLRSGGASLAGSVAVALTGVIVVAIGLVIAPNRVAASYLVAYTAAVGAVVGMLLLVMMAHLSGAVWFVLLRRHAERAVAALPAIAFLGLPLLVVPHAFWPANRWNVFFALRTAVYWAVWLVVGETLLSLSSQQDRAPRRVPAHRLRIVSAAGLPAVALAVHFAAVDWLLSLTPEWSSSVFGGYYFAGAMVCALALLPLIARASGRTPWMPTTDHYQALGQLTLAFVLFWGYLWYVQFFIIWIADIPSEVAWYAVRFGPAWNVLTTLVFVTGFVGPVMVLLFKAARGSGALLSAVGIWLLAAHCLDVYWLVVPSTGFVVSLAGLVADAGALALVGGASAAFACWRQRASAPVPMGDPLLAQASHYQAH